MNRDVGYISDLFRVRRVMQMKRECVKMAEESRSTTSFSTRPISPKNLNVMRLFKPDLRRS